MSWHNVEKLALIAAFLVVGFAVLRYASEARWKKFASAEGAFSVLMPGKPHQERLSFQVKGIVIEGQSFSASSRTNALFTVVYANASVLPTPAQVESILRAERQVLTRGDESRIISADSMVVKGYPIRHYRAITEDGSQADERIFIVERRLYILLVLHDRTRDEPDVKKFFDSFFFEPERSALD